MVERQDATAAALFGDHFGQPRRKVPVRQPASNRHLLRRPEKYDVPYRHRAPVGRALHHPGDALLPPDDYTDVG